MIFDLVLRNPAVRAVPRWLVVGALTASALEGVRTLVFGVGTWKSGTVTSSPYDLPFLVFLLWLPVSLYLLFGRTGQRCMRLDLALPVSARTLWIVHVFGVSLSALVVLAASSAIVRVRDVLVGMLPGAPVPSSNVFGLFVPLGASLLLSVAVLQHRDPGSYRIPAGRTRGMPAVGILVAAYGLAVVLIRLPPAAALIPAAIAVAVMIHAYRAAPGVFDLTPREAEAATTAARQPATAAGQWEDRPRPAPGGFGRRWRAQLAVFQILIRGIGPGQVLQIPVLLTFGYPFLVAWGLLLSGYQLGDLIRFTMIIISAYVLFIFLGAPLAQLHAVDPLPVSRRNLFAMTVLPALVAVFIGHGIGWIAETVTRQDASRVQFQAERSRWLFPPYTSGSPKVRVPVEYCAVAWDGDPPDNASPWGEAHPAWALTMVKGSPAVLYSPFSIPEEASPEFAALQISRAVEAVYGASLTPEEIKDRYLTVDGEGKVIPRDPEGITLSRDYPEMKAADGPALFPVFMMSVIVLYMLSTAIYLNTLRATVSDRTRKVMFFTIGGVLLVLHLLQMVLYVPGIVRESAVVGLVKLATVKAADTLPGGPAAVWLICAALSVAAYLLARGRFLRIEAPVPRGRPEE